MKLINITYTGNTMDAIDMRLVAVWLLAGACYVQDSSETVVRLDRDFSNVKKDKALAEHVQAILQRLDTFKTPVHPRIRLFYELLKKDITNYAHRTSDTLYNIHKYNVYDIDDQS